MVGVIYKNFYRNIARCLALSVGFLLLFAGPDVGALAQERVMIVMDGSGSMWGQIDGVPKLSIARDTLHQVLPEVPADTELGLVAYGHREKGNCGDIELVVPPAVGTASQISTAVDDMRFLGKTPLSDAVKFAAEQLRYTEDKATVILITDGIETCSANPCALGNVLEQQGVDFTAHVVGFGLSEEEGKQVSCLAENTGGMYIQAGDRDALKSALNQTILVGQNDPVPTGMVNISFEIDYGEGTTRPTEVTLKAVSLDRGETVELGKLVGAEQVVNGLDGELPPGAWRIEAMGPVASGSIEVNIDAETDTVSIPFMATDEQFSLMNLGPYQLGQEMMFILRNNAPLQDNATYSVNLFPAGATDYKQRLDFTYKFGNETDGYSSHNLDSPETAGDYEIIVMEGGYDLNEAVARFPISYVENATPGWESPASVQPGKEFPFKVFGQVYRLNGLWLEKDGAETDQVWLDSLFDETGFHMTAPDAVGMYNVWLSFDDQEGAETSKIIGTLGVGVDAVREEATSVSTLQSVTVEAPKVFENILIQWSAIPIDIDGPVDAWAPPEVSEGPVKVELEPGTWEVRGEAGDQVFLGKIEVVEGGNNRFVIPYSAEESPAGEDAASLDAQFDGYVCTKDVTCQITDEETGLSFPLPPGWSAETPYYYETAAGTRSDLVTVTFYYRDDTDHPVILNPVRWMVPNSEGTCTQLRIGVICRYDPSPAEVVQGFKLLAGHASFNAKGGQGALNARDINEMLTQASS